MPQLFLCKSHKKSKKCEGYNNKIKNFIWKTAFQKWTKLNSLIFNSETLRSENVLRSSFYETWLDEVKPRISWDGMGRNGIHVLH